MKTHVKHFGFGALLLLAMLLFFMPGAHAQGASGTACIPDAETLEAYQADGTLSQRQAFYENLGLTRPIRGSLPRLRPGKGARTICALFQQTGKRAWPPPVRPKYC